MPAARAPRAQNATNTMERTTRAHRCHDKLPQRGAMHTLARGHAHARDKSTDLRPRRSNNGTRDRTTR
eukprot:11227123-Lingulodinium_polyedra.AAC.1